MYLYCSDWRGVVNNAPKDNQNDQEIYRILEHRLKLMESEIKESIKALPEPVSHKKFNICVEISSLITSYHIIETTKTHLRRTRKRRGQRYLKS
jgi:hypothetical protein